MNDGDACMSQTQNVNYSILITNVRRHK